MRRADKNQVQVNWLGEPLIFDLLSILMANRYLIVYLFIIDTNTKWYLYLFIAKLITIKLFMSND